MERRARQVGYYSRLFPCISWILSGRATGHNRNVQSLEHDTILDRERLREVTLDDDELMREILGMLIDDTSRQVALLDRAIQDRNGSQCARLAHSSKGACANVGADRAAAVLRRMELDAAAGEFAGCSSSLAQLNCELELLRAEISES